MMLPGDLLTTRHTTIIEAPMIPMGFEKFAFFKVKPNFICMCVGCETIDGEEPKSNRGHRRPPFTPGSNITGGADHSQKILHRDRPLIISI
jgi:hypothetical protein